MLGHVLESKTPEAINMKAAESSWNPRGPGQRRPSKKRHPKRSPVHKRVKIPVRTSAECIEDERLPITAVNQEERRKLEQIQKRLESRITAQLQHMNDHG